VILLAHTLDDQISAGNAAPYAFEMHRSNLHDMSHFLALENTVTSTTGHSGHIQQFGAVNHVII
jgi:hypothetical protein